MKKIIAFLLVMVLSLFCLTRIVNAKSPSIVMTQALDGPGEIPIQILPLPESQ